MQNGAKRSKTRLGDEQPPALSAIHVPHVPADLVTEILVRLPSKSVLRARAVSKAWRRIATDPAFLAAHARRRPLELLLLSLTVPHDHREGYGLDAVLDTVPVSDNQNAGRRRLVPYTHSTCEPFHLFYHVKALCNGVLLLKVSDGSYLICIPMTRQWTELPRLPELNRSVSHEYGFYYHQPSGEFRLLCRYDTWTMTTTKTTAQHACYILSAAATEPRLLSMADVDVEVTAGISLKYAPVALHGRLHWLQSRDRMVVFDTESETFYLMTPPPTSSTRVKIFAMEGLLAAADFTNRMQIDLWFLQEHDGANGRWERRHQIATSPIYAQLRAAHPNLGSCSLHTVVAATDEEGIILRATNDVLVVYNVKKRTSRIVMVTEENRNSYILTCHVFRESLVQHECFKARPSDGLPLIKFSWSPS